MQALEKDGAVLRCLLDMGAEQHAENGDTKRGADSYRLADGGLDLVQIRRDFADGYTIVVDGIEVGDFNFVDLGQMLQAVEAIPVVVKSLVFEG